MKAFTDFHKPEDDTPKKHKDLSAPTPIKVSVSMLSPALTFKNKDSGAEIGTEFDVQDWSASDFSDKTTFTSNEYLGFPTELNPDGTVQFYWEAILKWKYYRKQKNGTWVVDGTWATDHRSLCICNATPLGDIKSGSMNEWNDNESFEKVMQFSCDWALGHTSGHHTSRIA